MKELHFFCRKDVKIKDEKTTFRWKDIRQDEMYKKFRKNHLAIICILEEVEQTKESKEKFIVTDDKTVIRFYKSF